MRKEKKYVTEELVCTGCRLQSIANKFVFSPMGFSETSIKILKAIEHGHASTLSDILKWVGGTKSNISQRLNFLEKEKLIERAYAASDDKRKVIIKITKEGKERMGKMEKRLEKAQIKLESIFAQSELKKGQEFLRKINSFIDQEEKHLKKYFGK